MADHATVSICVDCLMFYANGETPEHMDESQTEEWLQALTSNYVTLGIMWDDHDDDCPNREAEEWVDDCECENFGFSWQSCETCGSNLGGDRFGATEWWAE